MFKVAAVPPRRYAMLTVFRGTTAINDGTSAEPRRSWRYHCGLCRTNTAVAPRPRCDGDIMSAVVTICRGFTSINDETTAEPRRSWRWHCGLCRTRTAVAPRFRCDYKRLGWSKMESGRTNPTGVNGECYYLITELLQVVTDVALQIERWPRFVNLFAL